jgi:hypothetical protein
MDGDVMANHLVIALAVGFLAISLAVFWWGARPSSVGQRHMIYVFAWLLTAITASLVVFAIFPTTEASGSVLGITLGGAGAFAVVIWMVAIRASTLAERMDALEAVIWDRDRKIAELEQALADMARRQRPRPIESSEIYRYRLVGEVAGASTRYLGIATGDMRRVRCADIWVNPENTEMQMARYQEHSISGLIRYESARHDGAGRRWTY